MHPGVLGIVVFAATFAVDTLYALYTRRVATGSALSAGLYASGIYTLAGIVTTLYVDTPALLPIAGVGAFAGTFVTVWLDHHSFRSPIMWETLGKYALKAAVWCIGHPDTVKKVLSDVLTSKNAK